MFRVILFSTIALTSPACPKEELQEIKISLDVPDSAWTVKIDEVRLVGEELWVLSQLERPSDAMGAQVITEITDAVKIKAANHPIRHFLVGKTWNWENSTELKFIDDRAEIEENLMKGTLLYKQRGQ